MDCVTVFVDTIINNEFIVTNAREVSVLTLYKHTLAEDCSVSPYSICVVILNIYTTISLKILLAFCIMVLMSPELLNVRRIVGFDGSED
ncbi:hypothetical protein DPMN_165210 [Dreissena polymorpha]|uniref:Uncharacterized protein n=1 Tax=Dreissena polymorpha TaxID=45954 RepID=A0A9D4EZ81_DREPO|nr:hypothetical protein DPMN_165210 [Dreissena polymorpha]